jgi:hypothetical protein
MIPVGVFLYSLDRGCIRLGVQVGKRGQSVMWVSVLTQLSRGRLVGRKVWFGRPIARCPGGAWKWVFHSSPRVLRGWVVFRNELSRTEEGYKSENRPGLILGQRRVLLSWTRCVVYSSWRFPEKTRFVEQCGNNVAKGLAVQR